MMMKVKHNCVNQIHADDTVVAQLQTALYDSQVGDHLQFIAMLLALQSAVNLRNGIPTIEKPRFLSRVRSYRELDLRGPQQKKRPMLSHGHGKSSELGSLVLIPLSSLTPIHSLLLLAMKCEIASRRMEALWVRHVAIGTSQRRGTGRQPSLCQASPIASVQRRLG